MVGITGKNKGKSDVRFEDVLWVSCLVLFQVCIFVLIPFMFRLHKTIAAWRNCFVSRSHCKVANIEFLMFPTEYNWGKTHFLRGSVDCFVLWVFFPRGDAN